MTQDLIDFLTVLIPVAGVLLGFYAGQFLGGAL
jgi:hypothetical protein